jgi:hypothetical protein
METKRKVQFSAGAVIANGLLALSLMSPLPALANPCADYNQCGCINLAGCQVIAPPGCTATSAQCFINQFCLGIPVQGRCHYS